MKVQCFRNLRRFEGCIIHAALCCAEVLKHHPFEEAIQQTGVYVLGTLADGHEETRAKTVRWSRVGVRKGPSGWAIRPRPSTVRATHIRSICCNARPAHSAQTIYRSLQLQAGKFRLAT